MDKMREEFEKDYGKLYLQTGVDGEYAGYHAKTAWEYWQKSWQASRAALVVELPETCCRTLIFEQDNTLEVGMEHGEYYEPDDILAALDKAGIKYE